MSYYSGALKARHVAALNQRRMHRLALVPPNNEYLQCTKDDYRAIACCMDSQFVEEGDR